MHSELVFEFVMLHYTVLYRSFVVFVVCCIHNIQQDGPKNETVYYWTIAEKLALQLDDYFKLYAVQFKIMSKQVYPIGVCEFSNLITFMKLFIKNICSI